MTTPTPAPKKAPSAKTVSVTVQLTEAQLQQVKEITGKRIGSSALQELVVEAVYRGTLGPITPNQIKARKGAEESLKLLEALGAMT